MSLAESRWGKVFLAIAIVFIAELILGFNGKLLLISGIPVRMVTYAIFGLILLMLIVQACRSGKMTFGWRTPDSIWKLFEPFDYVVAAFLLLNAVWIFIIPHLTGYGVAMALEQTKSTTLLLLYFPLLILLRTGIFRLEAGDKIIKLCLLGLALLHIVFYVGEWMLGDASVAIGFFETIKSLTFGNSEIPKGVYYPITRIVYPTSLFLLMIFYYTYKDRLTLPNMLFYVVGLTAICVTLTKSLWLGAIVGVAFIVVYHIIYKIGRFNLKKTAIIIALTLVTGYILDATILDQYLSIRIKYSFAVHTSLDLEKLLGEDATEEELRRILEFDRTGRSNAVRIEQTKVLLKKWQQSPWIGFGYGSYAEDLIRGPKGQPFLYEMLLPSLLVQIGLIGVLIWAAFFIYVFRYAGKNAKVSAGVILLVIAICTAAQFNPFILGAPAMGMFLYSLLVIRTAAPTSTESAAA